MYNHWINFHNRISILFLLLILAHVLHATEEYFGKLWEVYTPAIFICNLISSNPENGFFIINSIFIIISLIYWRFSIQKNDTTSYSLIWIWIVLQTINVIGHISWTIYKRAYTPGIITTFIILLFIILLVKRLTKQNTEMRKLTWLKQKLQALRHSSS